MYIGTLVKAREKKNEVAAQFLPRMGEGFELFGEKARRIEL